jgi:AcrR family transcriptional regulator
MDEASGLPSSVAASWGRAAPQRKGPQRGLSVQRIVSVAVEVADSDGLAAVSMARVAADLGVSTMSLYRYVASKEELTELMMDAGLGPPPTPPAAGGWRAELEQWGWGVRTAYHRHPWALSLPITMPPITRNNVSWLERGLSALRDTRLRWHEKLHVVLLVSGYVRNEATLAASLATAPPDSWAAKVARNYGALLSYLTTEEEHPEIRAALATGVLNDPGGPAEADQEFAFGLDRVLDGVQVLIDSV